MNTLSYKQAYDKIIEAYFRDEIKPFDAKFCFCGTLNNGKKSWVGCKRNQTEYMPSEWLEMEKALYLQLRRCGLVILSLIDHNTNGIQNWKEVEKHIDYEDALFDGMVAALEVLKEIHRSRGENVDEQPIPFTKRKLQNTTI